jgi:hypothetical protein
MLVLANSSVQLWSSICDNRLQGVYRHFFRSGKAGELKELVLSLMTLSFKRRFNSNRVDSRKACGIVYCFADIGKLF